MKRIAIVVALAAALAACGGASVTGGGWGDSATGTGRATFAFDIECDDSTDPGTVSGSFVYQDKPAGVSIKGTFFEIIEFCDEAPTYRFEGTYTAQNKACKALGNCTGDYEVTATDSGNQGADKGDLLSIELSGGIHNGYTNGGPVRGGNIKVENS